MNHKIYIKIQKKDNFNSIQLNLGYNNRRKQVTLSIYPAESRADGMVILAITNGTYHNIEEMTRLSNKRLDAMFTQLSEQVETKSGPYWQLVLSFLAAHNYTLES